jgi:hypothetical protein
MNKSATIIIFMIFFVFFTTSLWAQKTDVVHLKNGDRLTGEIKSLNAGLVEFKTDYAGKILIEWSEIHEMESDKSFAIDLVDGKILTGSLATSNNTDQIIVSTTAGDVQTDPADIVKIQPVKARFLDKIDGSVELGLAYDKSTQIGRYTAYADATYRTELRATNARFQLINTSQSEKQDTRRMLLDGFHLVRHQKKRFSTYYASFDHNDELGLDLRTMLGVGYGYSPIRSNSSWLDLSLGIAANHENPVTGLSNNNLEAMLGAHYRYFRYRSPERSLTARLRVFPSLTDSSRYRVSFDTDFRLELIKDVYWSLKYYLSYDSEPLTEEAADGDYGITTSLGVSF